VNYTSILAALLYTAGQIAELSTSTQMESLHAETGFSGTWQAPPAGYSGTGNMMRMRISRLPSIQIGIYYKWAIPGRSTGIIYNRASVYHSGPNIGKPLRNCSGSKWVVWWEAQTLVVVVYLLAGKLMLLTDSELPGRQHGCLTS
jgi:hypothetical protein